MTGGDRTAADAAKALGNEEFNKKNYEKSIEHYTKAIELDASNHVYYSNRSASYGALGKWDLAKTDAATCVKIQPSFAKGYARLANALRHLNKIPEALEALSQGKTVDPENPDINSLMRQMKSSSSNTLPAAVQKELEELQPTYKSVLRELESISSKLNGFTREKKRCDLTLVDLQQLPTDTLMYKSVGKAFVETTESHDVVMAKKVADINAQVATLESRQAYLTRQKSSLEQNIQELVSQCVAK